MIDHFENRMFGKKSSFSKNIILIDDCEGSMQWIKNVAGCIGLVEYLEAAAWTGTKGLHITTFDAAPATNDICYTTKYIGYPETDLVIYSIKISSPDFSKIISFNIQILVSNGVRNYQSVIRVVPATGVVAYKNSSATYITIPEIVVVPVSNVWYNFYLIINKTTLKYEYISINAQEKNLSGLGMYNLEAKTDKKITITQSIINSGNNVAELYCDNILVTGGNYLR